MNDLETIIAWSQRRLRRQFAWLAMALILTSLGPAALGRQQTDGQDSTRAAAARAYADGERLRAERTATSLTNALKQFEDAVGLARKAGDHRQEALSLAGLGAAYLGLGDEVKAIDYYGQSLSLFRTLGESGWDAILNNPEMLYSSMGGKQKVLGMLLEALPLVRGLRNPALEGILVTGIANVSLDAGERQKALEHYQQALTLRATAGDKYGQALALTGIGRAYEAAGDRAKALDYFSKALDLFRTIDTGSGAAPGLSNVYDSDLMIGDKEKALSFLKQMIPVVHSMGSPQWEAMMLTAVGYVHASMGDNQKAYDSWALALPLYRRVHDRNGEAYTLNFIGSVYARLGEGQLALDYFSQALRLFRETADKEGEAVTLTYTAGVNVSMREFDGALARYDQALTLMRALNDRYGAANVGGQVASVYLLMGQTERALNQYQQALQMERDIGNHEGEAYDLIGLGRSQALRGDKARGLESLNQALTLFRALGDRGGEANSLYEIARLDRDRDNLDAARMAVETALPIMESMRSEVASERLRASYFASVRQYYDLYIDLLMRLGRRHPAGEFAALAFQASERARARTLLETLIEARADIRKGVARELLEHERSLQQRLSAKEKYRMQLLASQRPAEQVARTESDITGLVRELQDVEAQIRLNSPKYSALTQPAPLSLSETERRVVDNDSLLLEYALGDERSYLWAISANSMESYELPGRVETEQLAVRCYTLLTARNQRIAGETPDQKQARVAKADAEYPEAAMRLSRLLLGPVAAQLRAKRLLVVADGALQYIPFGALPLPTAVGAKAETAAAEPLVAAHEVVNLPSASTLALVRDEIAKRKPAAMSVAVLADPVFSRDDRRVGGSGAGDRTATDGQARRQNRDAAPSSEAAEPADKGILLEDLHLPRLISTRDEAQAIAALAPPAQRSIFLGFEASRATITSPNISQYRIVHLATHGFLNAVHPELSGIALSMVDEKGAPQDGLLLANEIYNLDLPAELVTLSACQTALGKNIRGEGLVGLIRGFMYAGAARVAASLWKVDDEATAELMRLFYSGMLGQQRLAPAAALQAAQIALRKQSRWRQPFYWAAFQLQGEPK